MTLSMQSMTNHSPLENIALLEFNTRQQLQQQTKLWQARQQRVALVPTMGNLHSGHLSLLETARQHADVVIVSIFVNPTQFGVNEDFSTYPHTLERDRELLEQKGCDVLFTPTVDVLYPFGSDDYTAVQAPISLANTLCGVSRPGHFDGVLSVVLRLFNLTQPHVAVFGEKDYQQLLIIQRMVDDLSLPIQIVPAPTVRETSGLALSSRNQYLQDTEVQQATRLQACLQQIAKQLDQGQQDFHQLEQQASQQLHDAGFQTDYVAIRQASDLSILTIGSNTQSLRVLVAAKLGSTRLIDNILWERD